MDTRQWMAILLCFATALMLFVSFLSYRKRHLQVARTMIYMMVAASCYAIGYAFEITGESLNSVKLSLQLEYLGIPFVSAFWLLLVIQFTGLAVRYRKWLAVLLFIVPTVTFVLHLTNDWHHWIYEEYILNMDGTVPLYNTVKGPWYAVHAVYNYTILLLGILLFVPMYLRAMPIVRKQILVLILGAAAPMLFNIGYMFSKVIDFTPFGFAVSGLVYAWGIFRIRLLRLTPLAYAKMFDTIRDGVILLDYEGQIVNHNRAAEEVFPELEWAKSFPLSGKDMLSACPELVERIAAADFQDERFALQRVLEDRMRHYICSLTYIYDTGTSPIGKMLMFNDITELKENEERLREKSQRLSQLNAFKDKLFTVMAHDIRDPIALLVSLTELLGEEPTDTDIAKAEVFQEIRRQVRGTHHLVDNLLDWYRSQNGEVAFRPLSWNLQQVVRQALSLAGARAGMKKISITERIDDKLTVNADKEMLDLIFRNLLSNAIKYSGIEGSIEVDAFNNGELVTVSVSDNGIGIDERTAELLRHDEMFFKEPGFASGEEGGEMRFGLVLTREFLRMHGGSLRFESLPGKGTTFIFTLPGSAGGGGNERKAG
ncbi:sensor histidine kinase [Paenibacillus radicis (ex Gao et al. 2016)]|uniref:histidine kinase n=1 Tax=Paenibacillus radicis (ex Gao et al. 2016) TaxID=1737354 RepID=A0A917H4L6_9BACL|nr:histidine kinase N-terminal 7TM domain-containing protein [Paenibacillus radicis (ex Gao et al. 2016)]GGG67234.1 two-component sensor histidine kinase [Paenibacillus radicis (ex Gao et al. 2016)]